jgi:hypothetical protein
LYLYNGGIPIKKIYSYLILDMSQNYLCSKKNFKENKNYYFFYKKEKKKED